MTTNIMIRNSITLLIHLGEDSFIDCAIYNAAHKIKYAWVSICVVKPSSPNVESFLQCAQ